MIRFTTAVLGILCLTLVHSLAEAQDVRCGTAGELDALAARALQTDLMVAALVCDRRQDYNAFVRRHRATLATHGGIMRDWFRAQYGRAGEKEMNRFVTKLANDASQASNGDRGLYCRVTGVLFDALAGADTPAFATALRNPLLAVRHGVAACGAPAGSASLTGVSVPP